MIPSKIAEPAYSFDIPITTTDMNKSEIDIHNNLPSVFKCDLCNKTNFSSEDELSNHIKTQH
jgi:hypothetical protein